MEEKARPTQFRSAALLLFRWPELSDLFGPAFEVGLEV